MPRVKAKYAGYFEAEAGAKLKGLRRLGALDVTVEERL